MCYHRFPFDMLDVLFLEKQKVEFLGLQQVDTLMTEYSIGQCSFVVVIIDKEDTFSKETANLFHLLLTIILHLSPLRLSDPVHQVNQRLNQSLRLLSTDHPLQSTLKSYTLLHMVKQPRQVELRGDRCQFL